MGQPGRKKKEEVIRYLAACSDSDVREILARYLAHQSDETLREILFQLFQMRRPNPETDRYNRNCFFLGTASSLLESEPGEPEHWGPYQIAAVGYIDRDYLPGDHPGPSGGFSEEGRCSGCGIVVRSNYKKGICPICGTKVGMT